MWVLCVLLLVLVLLLFLRVRVAVDYRRGGSLRCGVGVLGFWYEVYPPRPRTAPKRLAGRAKQSKAKRIAQKKRRQSFAATPALVREILSLVWEALLHMKRKVLIERFLLHLVWAEDDPADAAIHYGYLQTVVGGLLAMMRSQFSLRGEEVSLRLDYAEETWQMQGGVRVSLRVGQLMFLACRLGVHGLRAYRRGRGEASPQKQTFEKGGV